MKKLTDYLKNKKDFSDILLVSDLDGTLMNRENEISEENRAALGEFMDLGGRFSICTGRVIDTTEWLRVPSNSLAILHNGGSIYDFEKKEIAWTMPMPDETAALIRELQRQFPKMAWVVYTAKDHYILYENEWSDWLTDLEGGRGGRTGFTFDQITEPILKFVVPASPEQIQEVKGFMDEKYRQEVNPGINYTVSLPTLFEFTGSRSDKGEALKMLSRMTGVAMDDIIYLGDNMNDYNALKFAGLAVAPENALKPVREIADYVSVDQDEHVMADLLAIMKKEFFNNR